MIIYYFSDINQMTQLNKYILEIEKKNLSNIILIQMFVSKMSIHKCTFQ